MNAKPTLWRLFFTFLRIGLFTVGGGYAMLPMLEKEVVDKYGWLTEEEIMDYYAIGQSTPGIIAINTATFVGIKNHGLWGGIVSTLGMVTPSWVIITLLANVLDVVRDNIWVAKAFSGIRVMVLALILGTLIKMGKKSVKNILDWCLWIGAFLVIQLGGFSPIIVLIFIALAALVTYIYRWRKLS